MKTKKYQPVFKIGLIGLIICVLFFSCSNSKEIVKLNKQDIVEMLNSQRFVFVAERVNPLRGSSRVLTSNYDIIVKNDTLNSYLPYFGRAFQAPFDPAKGPLEFKSHKFSYNVTQKNKSDWQVYITPNDISGVQQLMFEIFGNGTATLNVQNTHRDPISFYGHIEKIKD